MTRSLLPTDEVIRSYVGKSCELNDLSADIGYKEMGLLESQIGCNQSIRLGQFGSQNAILP